MVLDNELMEHVLHVVFCMYKYFKNFVWSRQVKSVWVLILSYLNFPKRILILIVMDYHYAEEKEIKN